MIVKLPLVFLRKIPLFPVVPDALFNETLVSAIARGVVLLLRVISRAVAPLVLIAPLAEVMVIVLSVASNPR